DRPDTRLSGVRVVVPRELAEGERRVATVPETVAKLTAAGCRVGVQTGAGLAAYLPDDEYAARGADVVAGRDELLRGADVVLSVNPLPIDDVALLRPSAVTLSFLQPWAQGDAVRALAARSVTALSLDLVPRISRAQSM